MAMTMVPTLRASQERVGLYGAAPVIHVAGPPAPARGLVAGMRSAEQAHLERRGASRLRERGARRGASGGGGSAVKVAWSVAATEAPVPPVWSLAISMLAVVATGLRRRR